jgi:transposase
MGAAAKQPMNLSCADEAKEVVKEVLAQSPRQHGLDSNRWSIDLIQQVISWLGRCTKAGAWQILKRLGFSRKQALSFIRSPDPRFRLKVRAIRQAFSRALWHPDQAAILFEDELSYYQQPALAPEWGATGQQQPLVKRATAGNKLTRIGAAMDGITGQLLYLQGDKFGLAKMQALYTLIRDHYQQGTVFVVQDNCHQLHNHPLALHTAQELAIIPLFLPTYASWLNPIEKLWRWLRQDVLYNHCLAHDLSALRGSVADFLDQFSPGSDDLLHYCGLLPK